MYVLRCEYSVSLLRHNELHLHALPTQWKGMHISVVRGSNGKALREGVTVLLLEHEIISLCSSEHYVHVNGHYQ